MSKTNKMLIDASHPEETRVVVVRDGRVEEFDFESASRKPLRGNIYLAKITRVEPSLQAAFVEYGGNRHGFLAFSEIHPDYYQIPMADRIALLEEEAAQEAAEEAEADAHAERLAKRRSRQGGDGDGDDGRDGAAREGQGREGRDGRGRGGRGRDGRGRDGRRNNRGGRNRPASVSAEETEAGGSITEVPVGDHYEPTDPHDNSHDGPHDRHHEEPRGEEARGDSGHLASHGDAQDNHGGNDTAEADATEPRAIDAARDDHGEPADTGRHATRAVSVSGHRDAVVEDVVDARSKETVEPTTDADLDDDDADQDEDNDHDDDHHDDHHGDEGQDEPSNNDDGLVQVEPAAVEIDVIEPEGAEDLVEEVPQRPRRRMRSYKIQEVIKRRQVVLIQVVKEERGNKGAALTTYLSLAGRYTVLMPNTARGGGISRKITNPSDRKRLKSAAQALDVPEGMGLIVRTAGAAREAQEIKRDFEYLLRLWESVRELTLQSTAPTLVYEEGNLIKRSIRDLYNKDIDEIIVAGDTGYREAHDFMRMLSPSQARGVVHYQGHEPLLARYRVEQQLAALFSPQVTLRSGGYLVINQTEALVAIDVNSGKSTREYSIEETALNTNLEAAEEVARQVKLRDLAGLIVIDFIDMEEKRNNRAVERRLKDSLRNDRARIQLGRISHFGLMEMSRQRLRTGVVEGSTSQCPHCQGSGIIRSIESIALAVLRGIEDALMGGTRMALVAYTTPQVALYILNSKRGYIIDMEARHGLPISVQGSDKLQGANFTIEKVVAAIEPQRRRPAATPVNMEWGFDESDEPAPMDVAAADAASDDDDLDEPRGEARGSEPGADEGRDGEAGRRRRRRRGRRGRRDERDGTGPDRAVVDDYGTQPVGGYDGEEPGDGFVEAGGADGDDDDLDTATDASGAPRAPGNGRSGEAGETDADGRQRRGRRRGRRGGRRGQGGERGERPAGSPAFAEATANGSVMAYLEDGSLAPTPASEDAPVHHADHFKVSVERPSVMVPAAPNNGASHGAVHADAHAASVEQRPRDASPAERPTETHVASVPVPPVPVIVATPAPVAAPVIAAPAIAEDPPKPRRTATSSEPVIERVVVGTGEAAGAEPVPQRRGWWQRKG
ncbi:MAG: Rne/Rng family ribonuclease [Hyphomicrobiaceae bacterium]|nr:Rne/Rng family ribonuclease [Hyphomicrobiaceae bacterium]